MSAFEIRNNHRTYDTVTHKVVPKDAVVLDLDAANPFGMPGVVLSNALERLRSGSIGCRALADQIEAQTTPPRIPEPGLWGVVTARGIVYARAYAHAERAWFCVGTGDRVAWSDLIDPVLIRPGIEDAHCEGHGGPGRWYCCQHPDAGWPCTETVEDES